MFIETVPNRSSPPAVLLRESYRDEHGRAQKRTLANLSKLPGDLIGGLRALLKGGTVIGTGPDEIQIERSLPHGHVAAALGTIRKIALDRLILSTTKDEASRRHCDLVVAMIVDRLIAPRSKLGFVRAVEQETAISDRKRVGGIFRQIRRALARGGRRRRVSRNAFLRAGRRGTARGRTAGLFGAAVPGHRRMLRCEDHSPHPRSRAQYRFRVDRRPAASGDLRGAKPVSCPRDDAGHAVVRHDRRRDESGARAARLAAGFRRVSGAAKASPVLIESEPRR